MGYSETCLNEKVLEVKSEGIMIEMAASFTLGSKQEREQRVVADQAQQVVDVGVPC